MRTADGDVQYDLVDAGDPLAKPVIAKIPVEVYETLQEDILHVLGLLGWSPTLIPATHWSSLGSAGNHSTTRLLRLYDSPQLIELVARKYRDDIAPFGYTFPGRKPDRYDSLG